MLALRPSQGHRELDLLRVQLILPRPGDRPGGEHVVQGGEAIASLRQESDAEVLGVATAGVSPDVRALSDAKNASASPVIELAGYSLMRSNVAWAQAGTTKATAAKRVATARAMVMGCLN